MGKVALDKGIMEVITDNDSSTPEDKMRLFIIYYICSQTMTEVIFY
jgi:sec1 family domain-containing protein 1